VVDTVRLARTLLAGRVPSFGLAQLAWFLDTSERPCHRALPDARATGELLLALIGLAQERGAHTVADLTALAATRTRRLLDKRHLAYGAPTRPGVYLFLGRDDQVLYVGRARDLRARLRSYFRSDRQRPAVESAVAAAERIDWRVTGSELEAALEELRLIRQLRPAAGYGACVAARAAGLVAAPSGFRRRLLAAIAGRPAAITPDGAAGREGAHPGRARAPGVGAPPAEAPPTRSGRGTAIRGCGPA